MMYIDFEAGNKVYKLRLNTRAIVALEKQIGCNPLAIFGSGETIPSVTVMVQILHASMQQYEHSISLDDALKIFDTWLEDGHTATEFLAVIIDIFKVSGLINGDQAEKN